MTKSVCVFCGSAPGVYEEHMGAAVSLGTTLASRGIQLVYGGARAGLMGAVADAALAKGGRVVGVMPQALERYEVAHRGLTELIWTADLHERKRKMAERSDAFVVLPGGFGTLEEALEVISWRQMRIHDKPIVLVDTRGFFQPLVALTESVVKHGFSYARADALFTVVSQVEQILPALGFEPTPRAVAE
ncbi:TIGR00730 family Rossman fold protein [Vitiosangium sp. GDMCC 1.1324]|uniref:LOG family protein n=1 Tax=Vitiosangium sp. (strain GDMCC 1.1324) TaxID=2138576 RepID=UPI000D3B5485|nr:TIGR00730 family Rossman fold protein [Vitiosangium sp. GDMCC 1.1324]PTL78259.1 TIGR00730 family Rossman fold protein [Vitiosangium sp. GDMCC 1.1324]